MVKRASILIKFFILAIFFVIIKLGQLPFLIFRLPAIRSPRRGRPKKLFNRVVPKTGRLKFFLITGFIAIFLYSILFAKLITKLPSPNQLTENSRPASTQILDRNGQILYQIYEGRNRTLVQLGELPDYLINATIAIEDKHFYSHPGFDPIGMIRALQKNSQSGSVSLQGGSTITQQLIKNIMLTPDRTINRKLKEIFLSFWAERIYSKKEILQMYFNEAPFGGPAWGVEAAAQMYFGKRAKDLSLAESAYLAGLPAAPTEYSPYGTNPEKGKERQREVLRRMVEDGYISQSQSDTAYGAPISFQPPKVDIKAPHFVMYVRSLLAAKYGERAVSGGGLKVTTTLDLNLQEMTEKIVTEEIDKLSYLKVGNGAAMITDAKNGQILAMVGSRDYFEDKGGNFNVALALRQPGSSIKPVTYSAAFSAGYSPGTLILDMPVVFPSGDGKPYSPVNYDGKFHGVVTLRTALGSSYNVPAVKLLNIISIPTMLSTARDLGITTLNDPSNYGLSLTLGGGAVRMIDMMSVYGTFASGGTKHTSQAILSVTDSFGNIVDSNGHDNGRKVLPENIAYLITSILSDDKARAPAFGLNSLLTIPKHTVAVKTGTSDDKRDNWTFGYTPDFVVGTWVGNNDNSPMDPQLSSGITGAAPIWHNIMASLVENKPDQKFTKPKDVVEITVNGYKDIGIGNITPKPIVTFGKVRQKNEAGQEKEVTSISDPFITFIPTPSNP